MNTNFSKKESGRYIELQYNSNIDNLCHTLKFKSTTLCLSDEDANNIINKIKNLEVSISKELEKRNLNYKTELIIITFLNVIDSIVGGIEVRSKLSNEELAENFVNGYEKRYKEAYSFCQGVVSMYEGGEKNESFAKHWREYDKHNEYVDEYQFSFKKFSDSDFKTNLEEIKKKAQDLVDLLRKHNENSEG